VWVAGKGRERAATIAQWHIRCRGVLADECVDNRA
jgi:hypothetical protein